MEVKQKYFVLFCTISFVFSAEPRFKTRFEYDEQLLEKMVRMEFEYEQWEKRINETLGKMEKQRAGFQNDLEELRSERKDFDKHINETLKDIQELSKPEIQTILFRARNVADYILSTSNDIIVFTEMLYNVGEGYNSATGHFTAPLPGIYLFTVNLCTVSGKSIFYQIVARGDVVANGHIYSVSGYLCVSGDATVQLDANDVVYIRSQHTGDNLLSGSYILNADDDLSNSFSGVLLH